MAFLVTCLLAQFALAEEPDFAEDEADAFAALDKKFNLRFFDAVSGKPIPGATVTFEGTNGRTASDGSVTFKKPKNLKMKDMRYATFSKTGYVRAKVEVEFLARGLFFNRYSITRSLPPGRLRVVLDWSDRPGDLDAHLVKEGSYHISYRDTRKFEDRAWLDRDDRDGFGPETITINRLDPNATYRFIVHDYTNRARQASSKLSASRAHVRVYTERGLLHTFSVPRNGQGTAWKCSK